MNNRRLDNPKRVSFHLAEDVRSLLLREVRRRSRGRRRSVTATSLVEEAVRKLVGSGTNGEGGK